MEYLGAWGTLIHEKNLKSKISCQTPFKIYIFQVSDGQLHTFSTGKSIWNTGIEINTVYENSFYAVQSGKRMTVKVRFLYKFNLSFYTMD